MEGVIGAYELPSERKVVTNSLAILCENPRVNLMTNVGLLREVQSRTDICLTSHVGPTLKSLRKKSAVVFFVCLCFHMDSLTF